MKPASTDLFDLIHSLSMSEKRYVSIYIEKWNTSEKKIQVLYQTILKLAEYDEGKVKAEVIEHIPEKQFKHIKHDLYETILRALQGYYYNNTKGVEIESLIHQAKILIDRLLLNQAIKLLNKAKKIAQDYYLYAHLYEIERLLIVHDTKVKSIDSWLENRATISTITNNFIKVAEMEFLDLLISRNQSVLRNKSSEELNKLKRELKVYSKFDMSDYPPLAKFYFNNSMFSYNKHEGNHQKAYVFSNSLIDFLKENKKWPNEKYRYFYRVIGNHLSQLLDLKNQQEFDDNFYLLETLLNKKLSGNLRNDITEFKLGLLFYYSGMFNDYNLSDTFCEEYENFAFKYISRSKRLAIRSYIFINLAIISFNKKSQQHRYYWANLFYENEKLFDKSDSGEIRLMEILLLLDEGSWDLLESRVDSLYYHLRTNQAEVSGINMSLLNKVKKFGNNPNSKPLIINRKDIPVYNFLAAVDLEHLIKNSDNIAKVVQLNA